MWFKEMLDIKNVYQLAEYYRDIYFCFALGCDLFYFPVGYNIVTLLRYIYLNQNNRFRLLRYQAEPFYYVFLLNRLFQKEVSKFLRLSFTRTRQDDVPTHITTGDLVCRLEVMLNSQ